MTKLSKILVLTVFINMTLMVTPGLSKVLPYSLKEMVGEADWIIKGKVIEIRKTDTKDNEYGYEYDVSIKAEKVLAGYSLSIINVRYFPNLSTEPSFSVNERAVFFIKRWQDKNVIVQGHAGKIIIDNNYVKNIHIKDEEPTQSLRKFINKIEKIVSTMESPIKGPPVKS